MAEYQFCLNDRVPPHVSYLNDLKIRDMKAQVRIENEHKYIKLVHSVIFPSVYFLVSTKPALEDCYPLH